MTPGNGMAENRERSHELSYVSCPQLPDAPLWRIGF